MATLEEQLRKTLMNLNDQFSQAGGDLNRAVAEVAKAVSTVSEGKLQLKLRRYGRVTNPLNYELILTYRGEDDPRPIALYEVPLSGYPITERAISNTEPRVEPTTITSPTELTEHFQRMVADPESPLVGYLAFTVRQLEEDKREAEASPAG